MAASPHWTGSLQPQLGTIIAFCYLEGRGGAGAGGASEFQVSRMYSHLLSLFRDTERNFPVSTTAPFKVTLQVPDSQPVLPEMPIFVGELITKVTPAFFEPAISLVKNARIAARPRTAGEPRGAAARPRHTGRLPPSRHRRYKPFPRQWSGPGSPLRPRCLVMRIQNLRSNPGIQPMG
jgi:hypothetical protein